MVIRPMALLTQEPQRADLGGKAGVLRRVRLFVFNPWATEWQDGADYLRTLPALDIAGRVTNPADAALVRMARLDCDWHGENVRALGAAAAAGLEFLPVQTVGRAGVGGLLAGVKPPDEEWWFVLTGQHPQKLAGHAGKLLALLARRGIRTLYYAFDDASRTMPAFPEIAPHLAVLIHDELPLARAGEALLRPDCRRVHRSWVANLVPFAHLFENQPEPRIIFLGSQLGLTPHRRRQMDYLAARFGDRFTAICDHSLAVADRARLARYQVGFCPEGRKFATASMSCSHTDRPFWAGALGLAPVCEDSAAGGRLDGLHEAGLIFRYRRADLESLGAACDAALALPTAQRRRIYEHFNRHETIGTVVAAEIAAAGTV